MQMEKEYVSAWLGNNGRGVAEVITGAGKTKMALWQLKPSVRSRAKLPRFSSLFPRCACHAMERGIEKRRLQYS